MAPNMDAYRRCEEPLPVVRPDDFAECSRFIVVLRRLTNSGGLRLDTVDVQHLQMECNLWMATMVAQPAQALTPSPSTPGTPSTTPHATPKRRTWWQRQRPLETSGRLDRRCQHPGVAAGHDRDDNADDEGAANRCLASRLLRRTPQPASGTPRLRPSGPRQPACPSTSTLPQTSLEA